MDTNWPSHLAIDPRDLELNQTISSAPEIPTSFHGPHTNFNATSSSLNSWPNIPAPQGTFVPTALAEPYVETGAFDGNMSALNQAEFQFNGVAGIPGMQSTITNLGREIT